MHVPHSSTRIPGSVRAGIVLGNDALDAELAAMTDAHERWPRCSRRGCCGAQRLRAWLAEDRCVGTRAAAQGRRPHETGRLSRDVAVHRTARVQEPPPEPAECGGHREQGALRGALDAAGRSRSLAQQTTSDRVARACTVTLLSELVTQSFWSASWRNSAASSAAEPAASGAPAGALGRAGLADSSLWAVTGTAVRLGGDTLGKRPALG